MCILKSIPDFFGYYAGDDGQIYSYYSSTRNARLEFHKPPHALKPFLHRTGYLYVVLSGKKQSTKPVHRLICLSFHGSCPPGMEASHQDGNRLNNKPDNLEWETKKDNNAKRREHGTQVQGISHPSALLNQEKLIQVRKLISSGMKQKDIAKKMGLTQPFVSDIKTGRRYAQS